MAGRRTALSLGTVAALAVGGGALTLLPGGAAPAAAQGLVPYEDCDALVAHHREQLERSATPYGFEGLGGGMVPFGGITATAGAGTAGADLAAPAAEESTAGSAPQAVSRGATGTNLQEQDVDEPDTAKLRDGRIVVLAGQHLSVVTASATPTVVSTLPLGEQTWGGELLLVGDRAVVVLQGSGEMGIADTRLAWGGAGGQTRLLLVDLADPGQPRVLEEARHSGRYVSARLVGGTLRLVTASSPVPPVAHPSAPGPRAEQDALELNRRSARELDVDDVVPTVVRTTPRGDVLEEGPAVACEQVAHADDGAGSSTLLVTTLRPEGGLGATDRTAVTAHGDLVYASSDRLYVGTSRWGTTGPVAVEDDEQVSTQLHAFDTTGPDTMTYVGSGEVPGYVLGRWALSEHEGALRVATTRQPPWDSGNATSSSLFVLAEQDGELVETGRVDGLGRTEQIKAVRYSGDTAAVVTFRQTDPLYLLDLSDVTAPRVTGELKIPGFSTYLHPLGDGLLLGVGNDATEDGVVTGMQLSTFDVRDPSAPRQVDRIGLGQGWSAALDDSRAFGYDPARRLATLPFETWTPAGARTSAVGIRVGRDGALTEAGRLAVHPSNPVRRVLSHDDLVFAVGERGIAAGRADDLVRTGAVELPQG